MKTGHPGVIPSQAKRLLVDAGKGGDVVDVVGAPISKDIQSIRQNDLVIECNWNILKHIETY